DVNRMWHGSYDVPRCPTICSANGNGDGNGYGRMGRGTDMVMNGPIIPNHDILVGSSILNPVASAAIVAAQLGRRFPDTRFNMSC
ncbi:hypothetical protein Tco_1280453, partial [Tanacetum coccineum]